MEIDPPSNSDAPSEAAQGSLSTVPTSTIEPSSSSSNSLAMDLPQELVYSLVMKWRGTAYELSVAETDTVVRFVEPLLFSPILS